jgi:hypothetical protein
METEYRMPHFLIIGACKAGTTTLYDDLAGHPDASMPSEKEPNILQKAQGNLMVARRLYNAHFSGKFNEGVRGEGSTYYTMLSEFPDVARLARDVIGPDLRLVYLMRDPVKRIESHLAHDYSVGRLDTDDFDRIVLDEPRFINWSNYSLQLQPWIAAFGRAALKTIVFEEFIKDRDRVASEVAYFVGLDPTRLPPCSGASNVRGTQRAPRFQMLAQLRRSALYRNHLRPFLPARVQTALRQGMTVSRPAPQINLAPSTVAEIRYRLRHLEEELGALNVPVGQWFAGDA